MPAGGSGSGSRSYPVTRSGRTACLQAESSVLAGAVVRGSGAYPDERLVQGGERAAPLREFRAAGTAGVVTLAGRGLLGQAAQAGEFLIGVA